MASSKPDYDLIIAGGGLAGSALAIVMARAGHRILVIEREMRFRDRIRGELLLPWGAREAKRLALYDVLLRTCGLEAPFLTDFFAGGLAAVRDFRATTADASCCLTFPHPVMQETLLSAAREAGAEIARGTAVDKVLPGDRPSVQFSVNGTEGSRTSRLIIVADGRESRLGRSLGFDIKGHPEFLLTAGMLLRGKNEVGRRVDDAAHADSRAVHQLYDPEGLRMVIALTIADHLSRVYLVHNKDVLPRRLSGERDLSEAIRHFQEVGAPANWFEKMELAGPLATFDGSPRWVERPYRDGVVLIGDAAGATDPTFGEGLARTLRDVRLLTDRLLSGDDWYRMAEAFAADHDDFFGRLLRHGAMQSELLFEAGPAADARRSRAFAQHQADPDAIPDVLALGPDAPCDDAARSRYFGEA